MLHSCRDDCLVSIFFHFALDQVQWWKLARVAYSPPAFTFKKLRDTRTVVFIIDASNSMNERNGSRLYLAKQVRATLNLIIVENEIFKPAHIFLRSL